MQLDGNLSPGVGSRAFSGSLSQNTATAFAEANSPEAEMSAISSRMSTKAATRWVVALTAIGSLMAALDTLVVSTALSTIRLDLGASVEQLEWTVNAYNLSFAVLLITGAALGDRYGRRNLYAIGLGLFAASSAVCALAPDAGTLIAARAVQGAGSALIMPLGLALLSAAFPAERRGAAIGIFSAITGLAVASGPLVGGAVVEGISWEWIFWVNVPIGLIAIPLVLTRMRESFGPDTSLDIRGLALVTGGALGLVWGLVRGNQAGWGSPEVVGSLAAGALLVAAFVAWELRAREPMLPMHFFRSRAFSAGNAAIFFTFASLFGAVFFYAQLLQTGLGYGPLDAGLRLLPWTATFMTVAPVAGALTDRIGERPLMVAGLSLQAIGMAWLALIVEPGMAYSQMLAPFIVAGVGVSMAIPAAQNSVVGSVAIDAIGKAAGTNSMMRELGGVFGIAAIVAVFAGAGSYASVQAFTDGFAPAIFVAAGLAFVGALAGLALPSRRHAIAAAPIGAVPALDAEGVS
jgi:EmrB/QacA subfamily drug resistance transporter